MSAGAAGVQTLKAVLRVVVVVVQQQRRAAISLRGRCSGCSSGAWHTTTALAGGCSWCHVLKTVEARCSCCVVLSCVVGLWPCIVN